MMGETEERRKEVVGEGKSFLSRTDDVGKSSAAGVRSEGATSASPFGGWCLCSSLCPSVVRLSVCLTIACPPGAAGQTPLDLQLPPRLALALGPPSQPQPRLTLAGMESRASDDPARNSNIHRQPSIAFLLPFTKAVSLAWAKEDEEV